LAFLFEVIITMYGTVNLKATNLSIKPVFSCCWIRYIFDILLPLSKRVSFIGSFVACFVGFFLVHIFLARVWETRAPLSGRPASTALLSLQWIQYIFDILLPLFNPLNPELSPICHLLPLLGAHNILHVSRIRVKRVSFFGSSVACFVGSFLVRIFHARVWESRTLLSGRPASTALLSLQWLEVVCWGNCINYTHFCCCVK